MDNVTINNEHDNVKDRLQKRHPSHPSMGRPVWQVSKNVNYLDVTSNQDIPLSPRKHVHKGTNLSESSKERIAARGKKSIAPIKSHVSTVKKRLKMETPSTPAMSSQAETAPDNHGDSGIQVEMSDEDLPLSILKDKLQTEGTPTPKKKRVFVTRKVGIIKRKRKRTCTCQVCKQQFASQAT